ncbi:MAG: hypothetical protein ACLQUY_25400 [Ktedonobacterales bacterium]
MLDIATADGTHLCCLNGDHIERLAIEHGNFYLAARRHRADHPQPAQTADRSPDDALGVPVF